MSFTFGRRPCGWFMPRGSALSLTGDGGLMIPCAAPSQESCLLYAGKYSNGYSQEGLVGRVSSCRVQAWRRRCLQRFVKRGRSGRKRDWGLEYVRGERIGSAALLRRRARAEPRRRRVSALASCSGALRLHGSNRSLMPRANFAVSHLTRRGKAHDAMRLPTIVASRRWVSRHGARRGADYCMSRRSGGSSGKRTVPSRRRGVVPVSVRVSRVLRRFPFEATWRSPRSSGSSTRPPNPSTSSLS
jgi:hypothetical protein